MKPSILITLLKSYTTNKHFYEDAFAKTSLQAVQKFAEGLLPNEDIKDDNLLKLKASLFKIAAQTCNSIFPDTIFKITVRILSILICEAEFSLDRYDGSLNDEKLPVPSLDDIKQIASSTLYSEQKCFLEQILPNAKKWEVRGLSQLVTADSDLMTEEKALKLTNELLATLNNPDEVRRRLGNFTKDIKKETEPDNQQLITQAVPKSTFSKIKSFKNDSFTINLESKPNVFESRNEKYANQPNRYRIVLEYYYLNLRGYFRSPMLTPEVKQLIGLFLASLTVEEINNLFTSDNIDTSQSISRNHPLRYIDIAGMAPGFLSKTNPIPILKLNVLSSERQIVATLEAVETIFQQCIKEFQETPPEKLETYCLSKLQETLKYPVCCIFDASKGILKVKTKILSLPYAFVETLQKHMEHLYSSAIKNAVTQRMVPLLSPEIIKLCLTYGGAIPTNTFPVIMHDQQEITDEQENRATTPVDFFTRRNRLGAG